MTTTASNLKKPSKAIHIALWVAQVVLAGLFLMAGTMKLTTPMDELIAAMAWTGDVPAWLVRFIGASELLGAIGLLLPALLRVKPVLTTWAAIGIATIMVFALVFHVSRGEASVVGINIVFGLIAVFIAWGRISKAPIAARK